MHVLSRLPRFEVICTFLTNIHFSSSCFFPVFLHSHSNIQLTLSPTSGMVERHLDKWNKEEHNHFQCPLVQETVKKGKPALIGKIMVLGSYRIFIFDKAKTSSSKDSTPSKDKDKDKGKSSSSSKPKKGVLGLAKVSKIAQAVSKEKVRGSSQSSRL